MRGFNVMRGYDGDADATDAVIDSDGWLHTGDVATLDDDGYLTITDRLKDMFIVGGFNAYPAEIENLLLGDERIKQVAVVGMTDERLGEVGAAFVVPRSGVELTPDDVVRAHEHVANYKVLRHVEIVEALPVNATGKVLKHESPASWSRRALTSVSERAHRREYSTDAREHPALPHQRRGQPLQRAGLLRALHRPRPGRPGDPLRDRSTAVACSCSPGAPAGTTAPRTSR